MAAITNFDEYVEKLNENRIVDFQMSSFISSSRLSRLMSCFAFFLPTPTIPTSSIVTDKTSDFSMGPMPDIANRLTFLGANTNVGANGGTSLMLIDLLNISGGLNATLTSGSVNTPTLTRYTNGEGVMAAAIIWSNIGTTITVIQPTYTDAGSNSRQTSQTTFGGTGFRESGSVIPLPQANNDTSRGFLSVQTSILGASTGTAGNYGIMMYKPLAMISLDSVAGGYTFDAVSSGGVIGSLCEIHPDACLTLLFVQSNVGRLINGSISLQDI